MSIEKGKISGLELMFSITAFIQGSLLFIAFTSAITKHDTWLAIIASTIISILLVVIYSSLAKRFPGMNLIQMNDIIYGRYLGKFISIIYIYNFLTVLSYNIRELGDFYTVSLMPETPMIFFLIIFTSICAFTVWKGIEVIVRVSYLLVVMTYFMIISTFFLQLKDMDFSNFLPIFDVSLKDFIQGTHIMVVVPFGEIVTFLIVMAALNDTKHIRSNALVGLVIGAISFLIVAIRNTAILGSSEAIMISPSFQSTRLINVGNLFTRMDILVGIGQTMMLFFKCSIFYYATVVSISQFLSLKSYSTIILPIGGITVILAAIAWESAAQVLSSIPNTTPTSLTPYTIILPILNLLVAKIRNVPK